MAKRPSLSDDAERALVARARSGDRKATDELFRALEPRVREAVRRLVGQPDDTDDLAQDTLVEGVGALAEPAPALLGDTLVSTAARLATAFLVDARPWRPAAQIHAQSACDNADLRQALLDLLVRDDVAFDVREHIAFCLTCVSRSLPLEQHTTFTLVDTVGMDLPQVAAAAAIDDEHASKYVSAAREQLATVFGKLCRLESSDGACDQCRGLRDAAPEAKKGPRIDVGAALAPELSDLNHPIAAERLAARVRIARQADVDHGVGQLLHDELYRLIARLEHDRRTDAKKDEEIPPGHARWENLQSSNN